MPGPVRSIVDAPLSLTMKGIEVARQWLSRVDLFSTLSGIIVFAAAAASAGLIYFGAIKELDSFVKQRLLSLATLAAAETDEGLHNQLRTPADEQSALYRQLQRPFTNILRANDDLIYVYTIRQCAKAFCIILDAELPRSGEHVEHSPVMTVYRAPSTTMRRALAQQTALVEHEAYTDEYGSFLSAYAPLKAAGTKNATIVGVDMSLKQYKAKLAEIRQYLVMGVVLSGLLSLGLALGVSRLRRHARHAQHKHRSLVANMPAAIIECVMTPRIEFRFVNNFITTLAGYVPDDLTKGLVGLLDLVPEAEQAALQSGIQTQLDSSDRFDVEFRLNTKTSADASSPPARPIWVRLSGVRTGLDSKGIVTFEGFMSNITLRKATEAKMIESERQFRSLADSTPNLLWITNTYGDSLFFNRTWLEFTGRTQDEEVDDGWLSNIHPEDKDVCTGKFIDALAEVQPFQCWFRLKRHDGDYRWMLAVCTPRFTSSGALDGFISAATDITDRKLFEAQLKSTSEQLELFFRYAPASIAVFDNDMNYVMVSDKWRRDYGLGDQVLVGRNHYDVFPDISDRWKDDHKRCLAGEILSNPQDAFVRADGSTWWIEWELHPWRQDGEIKGLIMFTDVITQRKHLNDELAAHRDRLQSLVEARTREVEAKGQQNLFLRNLIATANEAQTLEQAVEQSLGEICRFADWPAGEATLYIDPNDPTLTQIIPFEDRGPGLVCVFTLPIYLDAEPLAQFRFYANKPFEAGQEIGESLADAEPQLARIIDRFRQERALVHARDVAENSARAKSEFLSNMSHELRTPMHAILNYAAMGRKRLNGPEFDTVRLEKYLGNIETAGGRLLGLLNNLLDLAKLEAGRMVFSPVPADLEEVAAQAFMELDSLLKAKSLSFVTDVAPGEGKGVFDRDKIMQVVINLLSNAIKFTPLHSRLYLNVRKTAYEGVDHIQFALKDEGLGIPAGEVDTIFEPFIQSSDTKSGAGGTGLGLSICREIIQAHDGRIWARNSAQGGAEFLFEIPCQPSLDVSSKAAA